MAMRDESKSHSRDAFHVLGFASISKAFKSFLLGCYYLDKPKKTGNETKLKSPSSEEVKNKNKNKKKNPSNGNSEKDDQIHDTQFIGPDSPTGSLRRRSCDDCMVRSSKSSLQTFSRTASRNNQPTAHRHSVDAVTRPRSFPRTTSTRILYSNSQGLVKPPAIEKQLDCTLDELCFGCVKKIKVTRDAFSENGQKMLEAEEELTIIVNPGWRRGTRVTFEGKNEKSGIASADVVFIVSETKHPLFVRRDNDLEIEIKLPLSDALTGCTLSIPLLGGQTMSMAIDEIVHPGYEKIIEGQGMPNYNQPGTRGNLVIKFLVKFPKLTEQQRFNVASVLQEGF